MDARNVGAVGVNNCGSFHFTPAGSEFSLIDLGGNDGGGTTGPWLAPWELPNTITCDDRPPVVRPPLDMHAIDGRVKASDVAQAHLADLQTQDRHGVHYLRYWVDETAGKIFCLVDAPDAEAANRVHREAHGLVADTISPVIERV